MEARDGCWKTTHAEADRLHGEGDDIEEGEERVLANLGQRDGVREGSLADQAGEMERDERLGDVEREQRDRGRVDVERRLVEDCDLGIERDAQVSTR